jgi:uncharacterized protein
MQTIFKTASSHPWLALSLVLLITIGLTPGIKRLEVDASLKPLLSGTDPRASYLIDIQENFGERPQMIALVHSPELFIPETLSTVKEYAAELAAIDGVEETSSIFNIVVPVNRRGAVIGGRILDGIPKDSEALLEKRRELLENSLISGNIINKTGDTIAILLFLEPESSVEKNHERILLRMDEVRGKYLTRLPDSIILRFFGIPLIKSTVWKRINWDMLVLGPVSVLVIGLLIYFFYRSFSAVFIPLVTGVTSAIATLGFMGCAGYSINVFLSIIIVLILVLGCTEDLHILSEFRKEISGGIDKLSAIRNIGKTSGRALLLTSATTTLSFFSIAFSDIVGLRTFAISCTFGMAINFLFTILANPAILSLLPAPTAGSDTGKVKVKVLEFLETGLIQLFLNHRKETLTLLAVFIVLAAIGAMKIEIDTNYFQFAPRKSEVIEAKEQFSKHFGPAGYITVTFETNEKNGILKPENLKDLYKLNEFLETEFGRTFGYIDFLNEYQKVTGKPAPRSESLPDPTDIAAFAAVMPSAVIRQYLDFDRSRTAIRLKIDPPGSKGTLEAESRILNFSRTHLGNDLDIKLTGEKVVIHQLSDFVTRQLFGNLVLLFIVSALLMSIFIRSFTQGLIFIFPNLIPMAAIFGGMGWLGIPLNLGTCPVLLVAFGIAVDDTIHFMMRYNLEIGRTSSVETAVSRSLSRELHPIVATSVVVAGGYLVITLSPSPINQDIGILYVIGSISALIADLVFTPILLRAYGNFSVSRARGKLSTIM